MCDAPHPRTLTHARLRRAQGDARGAIAILEALIDAGREDPELVELYLALGGDEQRPHSEPQPEPLASPSPAAIDALRDRFRRGLSRPDNTASIRRLEGWLARVRRDPPA